MRLFTLVKFYRKKKFEITPDNLIRYTTSNTKFDILQEKKHAESNLQL